MFLVFHKLFTQATRRKGGFKGMSSGLNSFYNPSIIIANHCLNYMVRKETELYYFLFFSRTLLLFSETGGNVKQCPNKCLSMMLSKN